MNFIPSTELGIRNTKKIKVKEFSSRRSIREPLIFEIGTIEFYNIQFEFYNTMHCFHDIKTIKIIMNPIEKK